MSIRSAVVLGICVIQAVHAHPTLAQSHLAWPLADWQLKCHSEDTVVTEAIRRFHERANALGAPKPTSNGSRVIHCGSSGGLHQLQALAPFQQSECFAIGSPADGLLVAEGAAPAGIAYAIGELEQRLRTDGKQVWLDFPEWNSGGRRYFFEKPAIARRGEYLNIGYDLAGITPHRWDSAAWRQYLDRLALARLNHFYFFLWIDSYAVYAKSTSAGKPLVRQIHERLREAIREAHRRGIQVTFMLNPTFVPKDLWNVHPEMHAEIEYVEHGFPCVCPNAPGAWELMRDVWSAEMEWFREADAVEIWFYDPGGCWCNTRGCKDHQAEILAREVREFGTMFRQFNPAAEIQYNLWPLALWEARMHVRVREDLARRVREAFPDLASVTAVGTPEGSPAPVPDVERRLGMRGGVFLFATNPESAYVFPIPHIEYLHRTAATVESLGLECCFGHRLEAGTRYLSTYLLGKWLWNPRISEKAAVRQFADWQTADTGAGGKFAQAIETLEALTLQGINAERGQRLEQQVHDFYPTLPAACRQELEYWPAVAAALRAIGDSVGAEPGQLAPFARRFAEALQSSKTLAPLAPQADALFQRYRGLLLKGWKKEPF